ncbi:MAG: CvpA family protein [Thermovirgaceae bacterium]
MDLAAAVDIFAALLLVTFLIKGAARGFSGEVISLAATVGGFLLAWKLSVPVSQFLRGIFEIDASFARIISLVGIYAVCLLVGAYIQKGVKAFLRLTNLSTVDRSLGAAAGVAKTFILVLLVYMALLALSPVISPYWMKDSVAMSSAEYAWPHIQAFFEKVHLGEYDLFPFEEGKRPIDQMALPEDETTLQETDSSGGDRNRQ